MNDYLSPFYFVNLVLCLIYPILRNYGSIINLDIKDTWGFKRENQIVVGAVTIIILRFVRYFSNWKKFIHEFFFYTKLCISILILLINVKIFCWYTFFCIITWLLFKPPRYKGKSNLFPFLSDELFKRIVILNETISGWQVKKPENKFWIIVFYSNFSDDCLYMEELFSKLSLKYSSDAVSFGKVDIDNCPSLASLYGISSGPFICNLPQIIMFQNGREVMNYPPKDKKGRFTKQKCFREKDIVRLFGLDYIKSN